MERRVALGQAQGPFERALSELSGRSGPDCAVVLEDLDTGWFVQFAGSAHEPLLLDLPVQMLTPDQVSRAGRLFADEGRPNPTETPLYDRPGGEVVGTQVSFDLELGRDYRRGARLAVAIFRLVFERGDEAIIQILSV